MGEILVGTASWTDPTLIKSGRFYPAWARTAEDRLKFYASQFRLVEVDSTYYSLPSEANSQLWVQRTDRDFVFNIKAFRLFTQHPTPLVSLPRDIRQELPPQTAKTNLYQRDLPEGLVSQVWQRFEEALAPLSDAGRLGVILFQFPPWFFPSNESREYILRCKDKLPRYRLAIEFRHSSWLNEKNQERTLAFLRENDLPFVCVDEPQGFKSSVPPVAEITADIGLVRFHGRNAEMWEKKGIAVVERFNYLYSEAELDGWAPKIKEMAGRTRQMHVLFNNCYEDKAVRNASRMKQLLESGKEGSDSTSTPA